MAGRKDLPIALAHLEFAIKRALRRETEAAFTVEIQEVPIVDVQEFGRPAYDFGFGVPGPGMG